MKNEKDLFIDSLQRIIGKKDEEIKDLQLRLEISKLDNHRLLQKACDEMTEAKRVSRMMTIMDEELAIARRNLLQVERENRNLKKWMSMNGIRKDI